MKTAPDASKLSPELRFTTSRSGGPGGQHVNKVSTKVTLKFDVRNSNLLTPEEKEIIEDRLRSKLTADGVLVLSSQEKRSQLANRENVIAKFDRVMSRAFAIRKKRKATKPTKASKEKRLQEKKMRAEKKRYRRGVN
ncbi:MAG TPA: alternative ribosome rescue aminoacyl-tRNA hydrolase ArfB [Cyclobacteriaceae bacterium]|nr:alternative ribosome rescue aminoacyl-tRNA hydrolase ArfB [Cyclobacteriaceae bacterium]